MKKLAVVAVIPLFAGFLWAQEQTTTTTTKTTTWNGTLVDAGCRTTQTEHRESSTSNPEPGATKTESSHSTTTSTECPVTTTTTTFGFLTPEGHYYKFDEPSNTKIVEMVKSGHKWHTYITEKKPVKVRVVGAPNGEVVVMETIR
jgi:hypothetical protein